MTRLVQSGDRSVARRGNWRLARRVIVAIVLVSIVVLVALVLLNSGSDVSGGLHH